MSPSVWHFPRERGPGAAPVLLAWAGQGVVHAGRWQVPVFAWQVPTEGGRFLQWAVMSPMEQGRAPQMVAGP